MKTVMMTLALIVASPSAFAMHVYAGRTCVSKTLTYNYDGPGSNYAVGGYSHLALKGDKVSVLAEDGVTDGREETSRTPKEQTSDLGQAVTGDEKLGVVLDQKSEKKIGKQKVDALKGKCEPGDADYVHSEWKEIEKYEIVGLTPEASKRLHVKAGDVVTFLCTETMDEPDRCPDSGVWGK